MVGVEKEKKEKRKRKERKKKKREKSFEEKKSVQISDACWCNKCAKKIDEV